MFTVILLCSLAAIAAGCAARWLTKGSGGPEEVTGTELVIGSIICAVVVIPLVTWGGFTMIRNSTISYNEYYSGIEKTATEHVTKCTRDGPCKHEYDCDPYTVLVTKTRTVSDGNGGTRTETYTELETRYHRCPYTDTEHTFKVTDTLGETYTMGDHWFPDNPERHKWRSRSLPNVPSGEPRLWVEAKERIESGNPGGTTKREKYKNYIQASQEDIYEKYSNAIASYKKKGLMPRVVTKVYDFYKADKVYLPTGLPAGTDKKEWQSGLLRLNGDVGGVKHGDLHLVLVDAAKITSGDEYTAALDAYWQSKELGKNTLSKNGIVIVAGFNGTTVDWARGFTGMPVGNEGFIVAVREDLTGTTVTPDALLPAIKELVFADQPQGFKRVEMNDYRYLFDSIQPSGWQKFWIALVAFLLSLGVWVLMGFADIYIPVEIRTYINRYTTKENA